MVEFLKAVLFGIVEGITEWLPISSTGHMILLDEFVKLDVSSEFWEMFLVVIQLGAILAVVLLFWNQIWPFGQKNNLNPVGKSGFLAYCKKDREEKEEETDDSPSGQWAAKAAESLRPVCRQR